MANNNQIKEEGKINFPSSYIRMNGQPLDDTLVWHDTEGATAYNRALEYAKTAKAYVGQVISVVEGSGENTTCKAYIIQNTNGDLVELGGATLAAKVDALIGTGELSGGV